VGEIARQAGVSQVTIYNYFGSKEALVEDVIRWFIGGLVEHYLSVMTSDRPFAEKLEEIVFDKSQIAAQFHGELLTTFIRANPGMQTWVEHLMGEKITPAVEDFFRAGIREGYIDASLSPQTIMTYFEIIRRGFYGSPEMVERVGADPALMKELIRLMTYGLNG
jgi:AcrR family transcriptional regulator